MTAPTLSKASTSNPPSTSRPQSPDPSSAKRHRITFERRHNGPNTAQIKEMLEVLEIESLTQLVDTAIPTAIRLQGRLQLGHGIDGGLSEPQAIARMQALAAQNQIFRSHIGLGYSDCITPAVIQRNILESPGWYTAYTPYQAELAQGRLEALLNFQTLVMDLTGFDLANASLLDEATAAAEAMTLCWSATKRKAHRFLVSDNCHPQTLDVLETRAQPLGIEVRQTSAQSLEQAVDETCFGVLLQYPGSDGAIIDLRPIIDSAHNAGAMVVLAADPLALVLLESPQSLGADVAIGSMQRFGMPMGFGGPHAAYIATSAKHKRNLPGRVIGVSKDTEGRPALRLAMQTREQHIRRAKATSNICTAQVLPAVVAAMYAVYHGPDGLRSIAEHAHKCAHRFAVALESAGYQLTAATFFDTATVQLEKDKATELVAAAQDRGHNLRDFGDGRIGISFDETTTEEDLQVLGTVFDITVLESTESLGTDEGIAPIDRLANHRRSDTMLTADVWHQHRSETEMLRYLHKLEIKDLALNVSMIPLGSCTMKLNATVEMMPITWPGFAAIHPFAPAEQTKGYTTLCHELEDWLAEITGFAAISLQPNAGSQGEYAGLLAIHRYHQSQCPNGTTERDICLIPTSAHGTNPASAVMAGLRVVPIRCDERGNIDVDDLKAKAKEHAHQLSSLMITYPSTHGVFEETIREICSIIHEYGGRVYLDGANMNAQVGLCRPGDFGADVCHLNLHKTFCIPHGGGGPGMGPIGVVQDLIPFLPGHRATAEGDAAHVEGAIAAAPVGSGAILPISWAYIAMMGTAGLEQATRIAILNANYIAARLDAHYPVLYRGTSGLVAHECILDLRDLKASAGVSVDDVAKRLIDYGFHAPTVSWPVAGTVMVEPTESECKPELDRFCDAMIAIREEVRAIERGEIELQQSPLVNAPHTAEDLLSDGWDRPYTRQQAAYPAPWLRDFKYWPPVSRVDNAFGDRNLVCSCIGMEAFEDAEIKTAMIENGTRP